MKRKYSILVLGAVLALTLAGCQSSSSTETADTEAAAETKTEAAAESETEATAESEAGPAEETETEATLEPITPSDYLISDAGDYVELGSYDAIPVEVTTYEITDDMVEDRIQEELDMNAEEVDKEGAAEDGDTLYFDLTYTEEGSDESTTEEDYFTVIGYEEFGAEFDEHLIGASAGDTLNFSIEFTDDDMIVDWAGKTIDFTVEINNVCVMNVPEYNDEYITNYTDYKTKEEYEESLREALEVEYEDMSYSDTIDSLFAAALDRTEFTGYPQELFDACKEETLDFYRSFVGDGTEEEICEMLGITTEDLESDILATVNQRLLVSAYCQANDITVTEEEYVSFVEEYASYYGEPDAVTFEEDYGRETIVLSLYESKFSEDLYSNAEITEVAYDPDDYETEEFYEEDLDEEVIEDVEELTDGADDPEAADEADGSTETLSDDVTVLKAETDTDDADGAEAESDADDADGAEAESDANDADGAEAESDADDADGAEAESDADDADGTEAETGAAE